jgi:hypothetical protein
MTESLGDVVEEKVILLSVEVKKTYLERVGDTEFRHHGMTLLLSHIVPLLHYGATIVEV